MKQTSGTRRPLNDERGFVLIASAVAAVVIFGMAGLAFDIGRMYITKNEAQTFADSASLYAAQQLNGTSAGLTNADNAVKNNPNAWNFATTAFDPNKTIVEYSADGSTNWAKLANVTSPATMAYVRVTAVVDNFPLFLLPATGYSGTTATIKAAAIAGQVLAGTVPSGSSSTTPFGNGAPTRPLTTVFPYSPIAHVDGTQAATTGDPFGFQVGGIYDLKWPHNANLGTVGNNKVPCNGDDTQAMLNRTLGGSEWGEIMMNSASAIRAAVTDDIGNISISVGQDVNPTTGQKNTISTAFEDRAAQDTNDTTACSLTDDPSTCKVQLDAYMASNHNGRRLVTVVVSNGLADSTGTAYTANPHVALGFAQFWLFPSYPKGGGSNNAWCGVYVGPSAALDTPSGGVGGVNGRGVGILRLVH